MLTTESQKTGQKEEEFIRRPRAGGGGEGLSPASLSLVTHIPCAHTQVSLERHQEWDY